MVLLDANYETQDEKAVILLYSTAPRHIDIVKDFTPYFYAIPKEGAAKLSKDIEEKKFDSITNIKKEIKGVGPKNYDKREILRLEVKHPQDVPKIREAIAELKSCEGVREADIRFVQRYLIDANALPMDGAEKAKLKVAAFDIETYGHGEPKPEKDPVVMISYSDTSGLRRVFTYKKSEKDFVETLKNEKEMIERFISVVKEHNVDILVTYNGDNFDFNYLKERCKKHGIKLGLGYDEIEVKLERRGMNMGAKTVGRPHVDLYPICRRLFNLPKYTLEDVYYSLFNEEKEDINPELISEYWDNEGEKLEILASYSMSDADGTLKIAKEVLPLQYQLSQLIGQPLYEVSRMGSGNMVEWLLMKKAFKSSVLLPNKPEDKEAKERRLHSYQGAYVVDPIKGIHDNILVFDFRSLYPSIILAHNIDPSSLNCDCCSDPHVSPTGAKFCKKRRGFIPEILTEVIEQRLKIKKSMKEETDETKRKSLDARQSALKILANSFYGYMGFSLARWYSRECAQSITAWGREYIKRTIETAQKDGWKVVYGDSIANNRFVTILDKKGFVKIKNIEELFEENMDKVIKVGEKEVISLKGYKALTMDPNTGEPKWGNINEIIRHLTSKKVYRVNQKYGETTVTEDHSLIVNDKGEFKSATPKELKNGLIARLDSIPSVKEIKEIDIYEVLKGYKHNSIYKGREKTANVQTDGEWVWFSWTNRKKPVRLKRFVRVENKEFESLCRLLGAYIAEGSSSTPETTSSRTGASISGKKEWLEALEKDYNTLFKDVKTKIILSNKNERELKYVTPRGKESHIKYRDNTHKLQMMNSISAVFFKKFCGQKSSKKKLPDFIFHVPKKYKEVLLEKMVEGDGSRETNYRYSKEYKNRNFRYTTKSLHLISGLSLLLAQLGQKYTIRYREDKCVYVITTSSKYNSVHGTRLIEEDRRGYVYDLSIEGTHMFVDSCGQILLHNTDSLFLTKEGSENKITEDGKIFLKMINTELPESMELEFEGFYKRGVFVTKKRYALVDKDMKLVIKGLETRRRDWSNISKRTQQEVLNKILWDKDPEGAAKVVKNTIRELREGKVDLEDLVIHTQLTRGIGSYQNIGPHTEAAKKGMKRGLKLGAGDIIPYIITKKGDSISDKAEMIQFVGKGDYDIDYYINNQVLPAVMRVLEALGYSEDELKGFGKQTSLGKW